MKRFLLKTLCYDNFTIDQDVNENRANIVHFLFWTLAHLQFFVAGLQTIIAIVSISLFFDEKYYKTIAQHIETQLYQNEKLPNNINLLLKKEFTPLLVRVPLLSMVTSFLGISTITHIVAKKQIYPRFDRKVLLGSFGLICCLGYNFVTILKTLLRLSETVNFEFSVFHVILNIINFLATGFLLQQMLLVLKIPGISKKMSEKNDSSTDENSVWPFNNYWCFFVWIFRCLLRFWL